MKLSIGMIVKNEEKYLEQCLTALKPILDNVDSELIIADTGSTDNTVDIAKKFTDNVYHFEWINDFAAARNSTIERAKGEWYLYIDADEIFDSCDDIIRFFNSGEYRNYNSAAYMLFNVTRNIGQTGDIRSGFYAVRLSKLHPETRFEGIIHERLNTSGAKIKKLNDTAEHYGYHYFSDEEKEKKFRRNSELLLKLIDEKGDDPVVYNELFDTYILVKKDKEALDFLRRGIECCKAGSKKYILTLYSKIAYHYFINDDFENAIKECDNYFEEKKRFKLGMIATDAEMHGIKASALSYTQKYSDAIDDFVKYFDLFKDIKNGRLETPDMYSATYKIASDTGFPSVVVLFSMSCVKAQKWNLAEKYLTVLPIEKYHFTDKALELFLNYEIKVLEHFEFKDINKYARKFDDEGKRIFKERILFELCSADEPIKMLTAFSELGKTEAEYKAFSEILDKFCISRELTEKDVYEFAAKYSLNRFPYVMYMALKCNFDISPMLGSPGAKTEKCVYDCYHLMYRFPETVDEYEIWKPEKISDMEKTAEFLEYCLMSIISYRSPKPEAGIYPDANKLLEKYAALGERYKADNNAADESKLPEKIKSACEIGQIIKLRKEKKYKDCMALIKSVAAAYKGVAAIMAEYGRSVIKEYEEPRNNTAERNLEMAKLAAAIKIKIRAYISSGDPVNAGKTLNEYEKISPGDPEIKELRALLAH